ncbi:hypothetical protein AKG39_11925 [Acetobacterium bakii]|uniref:TcdA-E operon negative regulator n=1 Tax=Acetobacterium bakii TaxID=52689 RepID=A0A0L6U0Z2_9FIRM|nr:hypothetical protein AKG39_11925 [Acetobacterium bakii]
MALLWVGNKGGKYTRIVLTVVLGFYSLAWFSGFIGGGNVSKTTNPDTTNKTEVIAEQTSTEKESAEKVAADKVVADKAAADKVIADKVAADKVAADKAAALIAAPDTYKAGCIEIPYEELARFPDRNIAKQLVMTGEVIQVSVGSTETDYRVKLNDDYDQIVLVGYTGEYAQGQVLEGDTVSFWGDFIGAYTYKSTMGGEITIPALMARYYAIN